MKKIILFLFLMTTLGGYAQKQSVTGSFLPQSDTLYPPTSLQVEFAEQEIWMTWNKPVLPGGGTPDGLLGYNVYRNSKNIAYVNNPDELFFFDYDTEPGLFIYQITAYYDLTFYGYPGQYGESCFSNADTINQWYTYILPFLESWNFPWFAAQDWKFYPSIGNWDVSLDDGNPWPAAIFTGTPEVNNFEYRLISTPLWHGANCASYIVEYDLKMEAFIPGDSSQLFFELYYDSVWYPKAVHNNITTNGWIHYKHDISEVTGSFFRIGFRAAGLSSSVINSWKIDNILVDFSCKPPDTVMYLQSQNSVTIYWDRPCRYTDTLGNISGYNVFRTDSTGFPPYTKLNEELVTDTFYVDLLPVKKLESKFRYCMNVYYQICVSDTSMSVLVTPSVGLDEPQNRSIKIFPNPVNDLLQIQSEVAIDEISLWSALGVVQFQARDVNDHQISVPTNHLPEGMYWVGISTRSGYVVRKVIIIHQ